MLLRRITQHVRDQNWFAVFLDFLIVVVGVFIGIQVSNWNAETQQQESVDSYLKTIASNIAADLDALSQTRKKRELAQSLSLRNFLFIADKKILSRNEVGFAGEAFKQAQELHYFSPNTSGFEALKLSGGLDRLQGFDIETLLYNYYDLISQISIDEQNHNDLIKNLWLQYTSNFPDGLHEGEFLDPFFLSDKRFQSLQSDYSDLLSEKSTIAVLERANDIANLVQKYERLEQMGKTLIEMVDTETMNVSATTTKHLDNMHKYTSRFGYPDVMVDGQIALHSYYISATDSNNFRIKGLTADEIDESWQQRAFDYQTLAQSDNSLHIAYPGTADWAGVWIFSNYRNASDSANYKTLQIELKGDLGGEKLLLNLEDYEDPHNGSSTRYELEITDQWQTYNIDLAEFKTADLSKLNSLGFVFLGDQAQSFSVRTIRFLNTEAAP
ncbi:MAG: hypothetical protein HKN88_05840 [Gammaproteobacteria bacterium]|nr:hypothetical protein [Gammaproteobacteria bacterium]